MSLRARLAGWIVLTLLILAPGAQAAPFSGQLELASGTNLAGDIEWRGQTRVIELEAGTDVPAYQLELTAARAVAWVQRDVMATGAHHLLGDSVSPGSKDDEVLNNVELTGLTLSAGAHITLDGSGLNLMAHTSAATLESAQIYYTSVDPKDNQRYEEAVLPYSVAAQDQIVAHVANLNAVGAGTVQVAFWNTELQIQSDEGERYYRTGKWYESTPGDVLPNRDRIEQIIWLELEHAQFTLSWGAPATLAGPTPTLDVVGTLHTDKAAGALLLGMEGTGPIAEALAIRGETTLRPSVDAEQPVRDTNAQRERIQPYEAFGARMDGNADAMSVSGRELLTVPSDGLSYAVASASGIGVLAVAFAAYRYAPLAFAALYSRLEEGALLENPTRSNIYSIIKANPGINARQIHRLSTASWGTVVHHLHKLAAGGYVAARTHGRAKCYYENHGKWDSFQEQLAVLTGAKTQAIADAIARVPGRDQGQIVARTGFSQSTVSYHILKLEKAGLVSKEREGIAAGYFPTAALRELSLRLSHEGVPTSSVGGAA